MMLIRMKPTAVVLVIGSFVATLAWAETSPPNEMVQPSAFNLTYQSGFLAASQSSGMRDDHKAGAAAKFQPKKRRYFGTILGAIGGGLLATEFVSPSDVIFGSVDADRGKPYRNTGLGFVIGGGTGYLGDRFVEMNNGSQFAIIGGCMVSALVTLVALAHFK